MSPSGRGKRTRRRRGLSFEAALAAIVVLLFGSAAGVALLFAGDGGKEEPRALIVDQLGSHLTGSGEFIERTTQDLEGAGYKVDLVPPERVTVELYRTLPRGGYDLIVLRSHAASYSEDTTRPELGQERGIALFTNEAYSTQRYVEEQRQGLIAKARRNEDAAPFFALDARFVTSLMEGTFNRTTIILLGCAGLRNPTFAEAMRRRGVGAFVSWDDDISAEYNDRAGERLIRNFTALQGDAGKAVARTMGELGPDPAFGSRLLVYP
jgi:hypothetical protein